MVRKSIVNDILKKDYDINDIERHIVYSYIQQFRLDYSKSKVFSDYFNGFEPNTQLFFETSSIQFGNIKELENYLELLIPENDRKLNGAFFTPVYIVDFIINEINPKESDKNLDPSCGCGAFLIGLAEFYMTKHRKSVKQAIKDNIFGSDILEYNIRRAKLLLAIFALHNNEIVEDSDFNLFVVDSLRNNWTTKFQNIVGNPPYVKFQDLSDDNRNYLVKHWKTIEVGTFNLYFAFFELGYNLLEENGRLGYITPNNYFTSLAGETLRRYFQHTQSINRIVDFSHKKVFDAQTYTAITFLSKRVNDAIIYDRIENHQNPDEFIKRVNGSPNLIKSLNAKKWRLLKTDEQKNIKTIETIGTPIGQLFDICVGIATLKDDLYFIDGKIERNGFYIKSSEYGQFEIEKEVTKPVYKISDFKSQDEANLNTRRIICPYTTKNGMASPIVEDAFKLKYPKCYEYFCAIKDELILRDKGKIVYEPFYVWGRTQGIAKKGKKLLSPTFSQYPRFLIAEDDDAYFTNGYGTFFRERQGKGLFDIIENPLMLYDNIDVIQKIFNSLIMHYYISKTSVAIEGGYPCYQKNFIENFTIPEFSIKEIQMLRSLINKDDIDEFLISKYHLNLPVPNLVE
jgi:methylase of polypeptide subunit release factors